MGEQKGAARASAAECNKCCLLARPLPRWAADQKHDEEEGGDRAQQHEKQQLNHFTGRTHLQMLPHNRAMNCPGNVE